MNSIKCEQCNKLHTNKRFCSRDCTREWIARNYKGENNSRYKRFKANCSTCNTKKFVNKYKLLNQKNFFCDKKCNNKWLSCNQIGKNNPNYGNKLSKISIQKIRDRTIKQLKNGEIGFCDTLPERLVENQLLFNNILYVKQYVYKLGIADFWLPETNIIIECDGDYWHSLPKAIIRDKKQTEYLENEDYTVIRLWERDIKKDVEGCLEWIQLQH